MDKTAMKSGLHRHSAAGAKRGATGALIGCGLAAVGLMVCLFASGCQQSELPAATRQMNGPPSISQKTNVAGAGPTNPATDTASTSQATNASAVAPTDLQRKLPPRDITFDTVKFNMRKDEPFRREMITPAIDHLSGNRVRIRGYILPPLQQTGITRFVLVRDNMACCFGPGAALYDSMIVDMQPGMATDYKLQPVMVEGTFNVREVRFPDGRCMSIYHLTADRAE